MKGTSKSLLLLNLLLLNLNLEYKTKSLKLLWYRNFSFFPLDVVPTPLTTLEMNYGREVIHVCDTVLCHKTAHFAIIMSLNQHLDKPHLSGGWIILVNEKFSLTGILTNLCPK